MQWPQVKGTILFSPRNGQQEEKALSEAVKLLRNSELVAIPTETVYGLGACALDPIAVSKIFAAKGRPADNPLIVHVYGIEQVYGLVRRCLRKQSCCPAISGQVP